MLVGIGLIDSYLFESILSKVLLQIIGFIPVLDLVSLLLLFTVYIAMLGGTGIISIHMNLLFIEKKATLPDCQLSCYRDTNNSLS